MFGYYFKLGLLSLRRNPVLTALIVLISAVGVATSVSTITIVHMMANDPIPQKSDRLFVPIIDNGSINGYVSSDKNQNQQIAYRDAINFVKSGQGVRRTALYGVAFPVLPDERNLPAIFASGLAPTRDFFAMFDVPFIFGQAWTEADETRAADVVVLSRELSEKLYGDTDPTGKQITMRGAPYKIVGVIDKWMPSPRFYQLAGGPRFGNREDFFIPLASALRNEVPVNGDVSCTAPVEPGFAGFLESECTWMNAWFEEESAANRGELQSWLDSYAEDQRKLGRLKRHAPNMLFNVNEWLIYGKVVASDNKLQVWLGFGFLILCLVNTIGLLLAKFSSRTTEIAVRRALGASRNEILRQYLTESFVIGLVGGVFGLVLAFGALELIRRASDTMAIVAKMDAQMLVLTFILSVCSAIFAGLLPAWRACQLTPAIQLKS